MASPADVNSTLQNRNLPPGVSLYRQRYRAYRTVNGTYFGRWTLRRLFRLAEFEGCGLSVIALPDRCWLLNQPASNVFESKLKKSKMKLDRNPYRPDQVFNDLCSADAAVAAL